jgi:hypothetical protein
MGQFNSSVKGLIYRIKDLSKLIQDIDIRLSIPGLSPGKKQSLIKDRTLKLGKVKSFVKRVEDLTNGNIITITFEDKNTSDRFRIVYTNISQEDAIVHLKLMASLQKREIIISEVKEVQTKNSLTKL